MSLITSHSVYNCYLAQHFSQYSGIRIATNKIDKLSLLAESCECTLIRKSLLINNSLCLEIINCHSRSVQEPQVPARRQRLSIIWSIMLTWSPCAISLRRDESLTLTSVLFMDLFTLHSGFIHVVCSEWFEYYSEFWTVYFNFGYTVTVYEDFHPVLFIKYFLDRSIY